MCFVVGILGFTAILIHFLYTVSVAWLCIPLGLFGLLVAHEMQKDNDARGWCITFYILGAVIILAGILFRGVSVGTAIDSIIEFLVFWN